MMVGDEAFDFDQLVQRCMGSLELAERLLSRYDTQIEADIDALQAAISEGMADRLASTAHRVKGSAANVGAAPTSRVAAEIEQRSRAGDVAELMPLVEMLRGCHSEVRERIAAGNVVRRFP